MYLVGGLRGGGWAVVGQAHHALVDGIAAVEVAMLLFDAAGHPPAPSRARRAGRRRPRRPPRPRWRPSRATASSAPRGRRGRRRRPSATAATCRARCASSRRRRPATALDRSATHRRAVGFGVTSLEGAREAGRRHGATINDVLLAAATIALGRALRRRGERPAAVKVLVPVNVRGGRRGRRHGQPHLVRHRLAAGRDDRPDRRPAPRARRHAGAQERRRRRSAGGAVGGRRAAARRRPARRGARRPRARPRSTRSSPTCRARRSSSTSSGAA